MPTATLNVDPGGYAERNARGKSGKFGSSESGDHAVTRDRRCDQFLRRLPTIFIEGEFEFAMLAAQHLVERLLEPFPSFGFRPKRLVIVDDAVKIAACPPDIADDLPSYFTVRINPDVNRAQHGSLR